MRFLRLIGAATAGYGVAVAAHPELLARLSGLAGPGGEVAAATATSLRPLGLRDAASGTAMVVAPQGAALCSVTLVRVAADFGDALLLGRTLPRERRWQAVAVSLAWGGLSGAALLWARGSGRAGHPR